MAWSVSAVNSNIAQQTALQVQQAQRAQQTRPARSELSIAPASTVTQSDRVGSVSTSMAATTVAASAHVARTTNQAISVVQTADAGLRDMDATLSRMRTLAVEGSASALSASQQTDLDTAYQALHTELRLYVSDTDYNGLPLLDGSLDSLTFEDMNVILPDGSASCQGIMGTRVHCQWASSRALHAIDVAIADVGHLRTQLRGSASSLEAAAIHNLREQFDLSGADGATVDDAYAIATNALASVRVQQQAANLVAVAANQLPQAALALLYYDGAASGGPLSTPPTGAQRAQDSAGSRVCGRQHGLCASVS